MYRYCVGSVSNKEDKQVYFQFMYKQTQNKNGVRTSKRAGLLMECGDRSVFILL